MNASVQQPNLNFVLTATTLAANLAYPTATSYIQQVPGGYTMHVDPSGTTTSLINQPLVFQSGGVYTFIATEAAFGSPNLAPIFLTDDNSAPASDKMKLRLINASPDAGNLDVYVVAPHSSISSVSPTVSSLAFGTASAYQSLAGGNYEIYFAPAGQKTILIDSGVLSFSAGQIRSVVALDSAGGYTSAVLADLK